MRIANSSSPSYIFLFFLFIFITTGNAYKDKAEYDKALKQYFEALSQYKGYYGEDDKNVALVLNNIAIVYRYKSDYKNAIQAYQQALSIYTHKYKKRLTEISENIPEVSDLLNNLGITYADLGEYEKAIQYYKQAYELKMKDSRNGVNDTLIAGILNNMGLLYSDLGRTQEAQECYENALSLRRNNYFSRGGTNTQNSVLENSPEIADTLNNLGILSEQQGDLDKALSLYKEALEIFKKNYEEEHTKIALVMNNLGGVYHAQKNYDEAKRNFTTALEIRKKLLGDKSSEVAGTLNNLGFLYEEMGDFEAAMRYYESSLQIKMHIFGGDPHLSIAKTLTNMVITAIHLKDLSKALTYSLRALEIRRALLDPNHQEIGENMSNICYIYKSRGELQNAKEYGEGALRNLVKHFGNDDIRIAYLLSLLGDTHLELHQYERAIERYQTTRRIHKINRKGDIDHARMLVNFGSALANVDRDQEARLCFEEALEIFERESAERSIQEVKERMSLLH